MGTNFDKTKEILKGDRTVAGKAITLLAMDLDTKFTELDKKNDERHAALLLAITESKKNTDEKICDLKKSTDERFKKIHVLMVISENWKLIVTIILLCLIVLGVLKYDEIKNIKSIIT